METSIRIIGTYEQEKFTVSSIERIEMLAQASDPLDGFDNLVGFWMELRDQNGKPVYRQIMRDPFASHAEVYHIEKDQKTLRINMEDIEDKKEVSRHLVLLVPGIDHADHIALIRSVVDPETKQLNKKEIVRISIVNTENK